MRQADLTILFFICKLSLTGPSTSLCRETGRFIKMYVYQRPDKYARRAF
jgi:hypothetical protein